MGNENASRRTPTIAGQRRRLSDITNTPMRVNCVKPRDENSLLTRCAAQLEKELNDLKKLLKEKEAIIEMQKRNTEKLWLNYYTKSKTNDEIITHNAQLYKDLMQARDKLKLLQHENAQMAVMHKICKSELQSKLAQALEQLGSLQATCGPSSNLALVKQVNAPSVPTEPVACRIVDKDSTTANIERGDVNSKELVNVVGSRVSSRRRESISLKEPSLKTKLRQAESTVSHPKISAKERKNLVPGLNSACEEQAVSVTGTLNCTDSVVINDIEVGSSHVEASQREKHVDSAGVGNAEIHGGGFINRASTGSDEDLKLQKNSTGRPLRRTVSSIGSYKEAPLNTKMRRPA